MMKETEYCYECYSSFWKKSLLRSLQSNITSRNWEYYDIEETENSIFDTDKLRELLKTNSLIYNLTSDSAFSKSICADFCTGLRRVYKTILSFTYDRQRFYTTAALVNEICKLNINCQKNFLSYTDPAGRALKHVSMLRYNKYRLSHKVH